MTATCEGDGVGYRKAASIVNPYELLPVFAKAIVVWKHSDCEVAR